MRTMALTQSAKTAPSPRPQACSVGRPVLQRKCVCGRSELTSECDECRKKRLQGKAQNSEVEHPTTRGFMESRVRHDFGKVRVYSDTRAAESAPDTNALANIDKASAALPQTLKDVQVLVADLRGTAAEIKAVAENANGVLGAAGPEVTTAMQRVRVVADNLATASSRLDKLVDENRQDIRGFTREGLPELERFLREGRAAAREFRELSRSLREDPSQLLYQRPQQGVEIPR